MNKLWIMPDFSTHKLQFITRTEADAFGTIGQHAKEMSIKMLQFTMHLKFLALPALPRQDSFLLI